MKFLLVLITIVSLAKECKDKNVSEIRAAQKNQEKLTIVYRASSRGFFEEITLSNNTLTICNDRAREQIKYYKNNANNWDEYLKLLAQIDLNNLPNIKAPTAMRDYDGAAHATLIIKDKSKEIKSSTFDHEYPPSEIKALVEKLLSFKKNTLKQ